MTWLSMGSVYLSLYIRSKYQMQKVDLPRRAVTKPVDPSAVDVPASDYVLTAELRLSKQLY